MKTEELYRYLVELMTRFDITVAEENFRSTGTRTQGGYCVLRGKKMFLLNKRLAVTRKNELMIDFIRTLPHENVYMVPAVRRYFRPLENGEGSNGPSLERE